MIDHSSQTTGTDSETSLPLMRFNRNRATLKSERPTALPIQYL